MEAALYARSVANRGNLYRLNKLIERAKAGEELKLAFLGGSITQGCHSSTPYGSYAYLTYDWFVREFPNSKFKYINAGIGGTTSQFACARAIDDCLNENPDFVLVEFSVNDEANDFFKETFESLIRLIYGRRNKPAVMILNNLFYEDGRNAQEQHNEIGKYYGIPCISVRDTIWPEIEEGRMMAEDLTTDKLHPNDLGHMYLHGLVTCFLSTEVVSGNGAKDPEFPMPAKPRTSNGYARTTRHQNYNSTPELNGFTVDDAPQNGIGDVFKRGWTASNVGDSIRFDIFGSELAVQYRKTINKPSPVAELIVDGDEAHKVILDGNFTETWGDSLHIDTILHHGRYIGSSAPESMIQLLHHVEIRIVETHEDDRTPFCLVSLITA